MTSPPGAWTVEQLCVRARDDAMELANLTSALEGTIDPDNSAIVAMMDKYKNIVVKNKEMAAVTDLPGANTGTNKSSQGMQETCAPA